MLRKISLILSIVLYISNIPSIAHSENINDSSSNLSISTKLIEENLSNTTEKNTTEENISYSKEIKSYNSSKSILETPLEETDLEENTISDENHMEIIKEENITKNLYKKTKVLNQKKYTSNLLDEKGILREEFLPDQQGLESLEYLIPKTNSNFEIALALNDGNYSYISSSDNYSEAIDLLTQKKKELSNFKGILTILNSKGQIIYAEQSIGRIIKHINGTPDLTNSNISNIYTSSNLKTPYTYVNHGYIDDVPIIEDLGESAKVMVSGYTGWMNKNSNSSDYDLAIVPLNQVKNPSHYIVKEGILNHFISNDISSSNLSGTYLSLGPAPSYLNSNTKYYSYDGKYFFKDLNTLINNLKNNTFKDSVNSNNPYYSYYLNLPFRSKTQFSANQINNFLSKKTTIDSKLINSGQAFIDAQNKYGVNALLMLGISINESRWGLSDISKTKNNIFGINAIDQSPGQSANYFNSIADCINSFAEYYISKGYSDPQDWRYNGSHLGNKALGANVKYASDPFWSEKASKYIFDFDYTMSYNQLNNLLDFNYYQLGIYNMDSNVDTFSSEYLYKSKFGTPTIVLDKRPYSINNTLNYRISPDRTTNLNTGEFTGNYPWNVHGFTNTNSITFINSGKTFNIFSDIQGHFAQQAIEDFAFKGFIIGYDDGTFRPSTAVTRAEFIKLINKGFGYTNPGSENFNDVNPEDWFYDDVRIALNNGYINPNFENFRPNDLITREETAVILTNIKKNKDENLDKLLNYSDYNDVSIWAKSSVEGAIEAGYMGQNVTEFRPLDNLSRSEAVLVIERVNK